MRNTGGTRDAQQPVLMKILLLPDLEKILRFGITGFFEFRNH